mmetsp:Transcript_11833/g.34245  ORF Transcript_11833/g.34245 Transcript_11833/m.34245 type:complete len:349 (-) Transcript_11833:29-1075(-)
MPSTCPRRPRPLTFGVSSRLSHRGPLSPRSRRRPAGQRQLRGVAALHLSRARCSCTARPISPSPGAQRAHACVSCRTTSTLTDRRAAWSSAGTRTPRTRPSRRCGRPARSRARPSRRAGAWRRRARSRRRLCRCQAAGSLSQRVRLVRAPSRIGWHASASSTSSRPSAPRPTRSAARACRAPPTRGSSRPPRRWSAGSTGSWSRRRRRARSPCASGSKRGPSSSSSQRRTSPARSAAPRSPSQSTTSSPRPSRSRTPPTPPSCFPSRARAGAASRHRLAWRRRGPPPPPSSSPPPLPQVAAPTLGGGSGTTRRRWCDRVREWTTSRPAGQDPCRVSLRRSRNEDIARM